MNKTKSPTKALFLSISIGIIGFLTFLSYLKKNAKITTPATINKITAIGEIIPNIWIPSKIATKPSVIKNAPSISKWTTLS